ncbi:phage holin family protein [Pedobacter cryoconitis]|uniref:Holin family protein n=1 Tax=Pedobacter cryoconitis TaxID=188932 RepID=A0A327S8B0_9SPHI|nr:phage holin family protein [Pedobacter cryoconitis]RAJ25008.1 holin family protein [Pedobacter cryoconitis]
MISEILKQAVVWFLKLCTFILIYITPIHSILITVYLLLSFDLVSGITKALKVGEKITAAKLKLSIIKFMYYSLGIIAAFQIDTAMISPDSLLLTRIIAGYITMVEFKSLIENISVITGRDIWMAVKDKIIDIFNLKVMKKGE